jgi:hypothetical protein
MKCSVPVLTTRDEESERRIPECKFMKFCVVIDH